MGLVEELQQEHEYISQLLGDVQQKGIASEEGKNELFRVKEKLLEHLRKEDERLYPPLQDYAKNDAQFKDTLNWYISQMAEISKKAMEFFNKYENVNENSTEFYKDVGELIALLKSRISKEEMILFKKYNEVAR